MDQLMKLTEKKPLNAINEALGERWSWQTDTCSSGESMFDKKDSIIDDEDGDDNLENDATAFDK